MFHVRTALHYYKVVWVLLACLFVVDRASKLIAVEKIPTTGTFALPNQSLGFIVEKNQGIAFSFPLPQFVIIGVVTVIVAYLVFVMLRAAHLHEHAIVWGSGLIIVGAIANACDRIRFGYVIDFIRLTRWPTFNLADTYIIIGVSILIGFYLFTNKFYARPTAHGNDRRN